MRKVFWILCFWIPIAAFSETLEIAGKVVDKITQDSIANAVIMVFPSGEKTVSKANGNFYLETERKENLFVQILKPGYQSLKINQGFNEIFAELILDTRTESAQTVVVRGKKDEKRVIVSKQSLGKEEIKKSTSNIFEDSIKVVQTLPGVVSLGFSSEMYIRGGDSYEFSSFYDRAYLTDPYVLGGALSVFNPDVVGTIDFYTGAFPAEYSNGLSGVLDVKMRDGSTQAFSGFTEISLTSLTLLFEGPLSLDDHSTDSVLFAFRRTYYDLAAKLFFDRSGIQLPYFYDTHLRFKIQLDESNILRIFSLGVYEGVDIQYDDFNGNESPNFKSGSEASYLNLRILQGFTLTSALSSGTVMENTVSYLYRYGDLKFFTDPNRYLDIQPEEHFFQYRGDLTFDAGTHLLKTGAGLYGAVSNLDLNILIRGFEPGLTYSQPPYPTVSQVPVNEFRQKYQGRLALFPTAYVQDDIQLIEKTLYLNVGLNVQYLNIGGQWIADPRAGLKLSLDSVDLKLAGGSYSQFPITKDFGRILDEKYGNPDIRPEKSYHLVFGAEKDLEGYFIRTEFFGKYYKDLVTEDYRENFVNGEIGYSYGFEVFLQKKIGKNFDGWISYTYVMTRRKVTQRISEAEYNQGLPAEQQKGTYDIPFNQWYSPLYDRRHSLNIVMNYEFTPKWKISSTFKFGTGTPYTEITGANAYGIDTDGNPSTAEEWFYTPVKGNYNEKRLPYYLNLDIKLSMPFFWENWSAYIQVLNALYTQNIMGYSYSPDYRTKRENKGIPVPVPIFGIRAQF